MSEKYYDQMRKRITAANAKFKKARPATFEGFNMLHGEVAAEDGRHLDPKIKEIIALAISVSERCDPCIAFHARAALRNGATREEIMDMLTVVVMMGGGPALMYCAHVVEVLDEELGHG